MFSRITPVKVISLIDIVSIFYSLSALRRSLVFLFVSRFVWDCKGRNLFVICKLYFKIIVRLFSLSLPYFSTSNMTTFLQTTTRFLSIAECKGNHISHTCKTYFDYIRVWP
jgi:hypothetical protein